jgi:hypothetical protein
LEFDPELEPLGVSGTYSGHDGILRFIATFYEAWEDPKLVPALVLDIGDRAVVLGHVRVRGAGSGVELEREFAQVITLSRGLVAQEREFLSWDKGLRAAELDPGALGLPSRAGPGRKGPGAE